MNKEIRDSTGTVYTVPDECPKLSPAISHVEPQQLPCCSSRQETIVTQCKLLNGDIKRYHISSEVKQIPQPILFDYLGVGIVYSVNNFRCRSTARKHFWKRKG